MSLLIKQITSHDGRLGNRANTGLPSREHAVDHDLPAAHDDFFGQFTSLPQMTEVRDKNQLVRDANDAVSLTQIADDALDATLVALFRMRTLSQPERGAAARQLSERFLEQLQLTEDIWRLAQKTRFNNQPLLTGQVKGQLYPAGTGTENLLPIHIDDVAQMALELQRDLGIVLRQQAQAGESAIASAQTERIEQDLDKVSRLRHDLDGLQTRFITALAQLRQLRDDTDGLALQLSAPDIAAENAQIARDAIAQHGDEAVPIQANQETQLSMHLLQ
jgi:flagellin